QDLKSLVKQQKWHEIVVTIFRRRQFPLRGIADERLLEAALREIPDGEHYQFVRLSYFPDNLADWGEGTSHAELRSELAEVFGRWVAIGQEPTCMWWQGTCDPEEVFEVDVLRKNNFEVRKNQDYYERYVREPQRYRWIEIMWQE